MITKNEFTAMVMKNVPEMESVVDVISTAMTAEEMYATYKANWPKIMAFNAKIEGIRLGVLNTCNDVIAKAHEAYKYTHSQCILDFSETLRKNLEDIHKMFLKSQEPLTLKASIGEGLDEAISTYENSFIEMYTLQIDAAERIARLISKELDLLLGMSDTDSDSE